MPGRAGSRARSRAAPRPRSRPPRGRSRGRSGTAPRTGRSGGRRCCSWPRPQRSARSPERAPAAVQQAADGADPSRRVGSASPSSCSSSARSPVAKFQSGVPPGRIVAVRQRQAVARVLLLESRQHAGPDERGLTAARAAMDDDQAVSARRSSTSSIIRSRPKKIGHSSRLERAQAGIGCGRKRDRDRAAGTCGRRRCSYGAGRLRCGGRGEPRFAAPAPRPEAAATTPMPNSLAVGTPSPTRSITAQGSLLEGFRPA